MSLLRQSLVVIVCSAAACTEARADDSTVLQRNLLLGGALGEGQSRSEPHKLAPSQADGLDGVKFSNPYAPPEGTTQVKRSAFPAAPYRPPTEPKGGLSIFAGRAGSGTIR